MFKALLQKTKLQPKDKWVATLQQFYEMEQFQDYDRHVNQFFQEQFTQPTYAEIPMQTILQTILEQMESVEKKGYILNQMTMNRAKWCSALILNKLNAENEKSFEYIDQVIEKEDRSGKGLLYFTKADFYKKKNQLQEYIQNLKLGIESIGSNINDKNGIDVSSAYLNLYMHEPTKENLKLLERSFSIMENTYGWSHFQTIHIAKLLCKQYLENGVKTDVAILLSEKCLVALELYCNHVSEVTKELIDATLQVTLYLSQSYAKKKLTELQISVLNRGIQTLKKHSSIHPFAMAKLYHSLAIARYLAQQPALALTTLNKIEKNQYLSLLEEEDVAYFYYFKGLLLGEFVSGKSVEAIACFEKAQTLFANQKEWQQSCIDNIRKIKEKNG